MNSDVQYQVRVVYPPLSILKLFIDSIGMFSLTKISHKSRLNQSNAYRLISALIDHGFLDQSIESGKYRLSATTLALGNAFLRGNDLYQRAHPKLVELRDNCGETVHHYCFIWRRSCIYG